MPSKKYKTLMVWMLAVAMAVSGLALRGAAQAKAAMPTRPDVLVVVYQRPGLGDEVGITYAHRVPRAQAEAQQRALAQATGWAMMQTRISDGAPPTQGKIAPMTSVSFVAPNVIQNETHTLPVEPFVTAYRSEKRINLIFMVASGFQFQGLQQFADNNVRINQEQHGSAYTYQIQILNSHFGRLTLPQSTPAAGVTTSAGKGGPSSLVLFLGIVGAAGASGLLVYFLMSRFTGTPEKAQFEAGEEAVPTDADEKTEIGIKR